MTGYGPPGDAFADSELGRLWGRCRTETSLQDIACALNQLSALWRWRAHGSRIRDALAAELPRTVGDDERLLTPSGWLSERPVRKYTLEQRVPRILQILPAGVPLPRENLESFAALVRELRAHGASVVAVALPYAPQLEEALVERYPAWSVERAAGYAALSAAAELPIVAVDAYGSWWNDQSQNDLRHLSRKGAGPFTRQLWQMPAFRQPILEALGLEG